MTAVHGDAVLGHPGSAAFDAVHAGFAVRRIPAAWLTQSRPGARIVAPYSTLWSHTGLIGLVRQSDSSATGLFSRTRVSFMWEDAQRPLWPAPAEHDERVCASPVDPREVLQSPACLWAVGLQLPGVTFDPVTASGDRTLRLWSLDGSTAAVHVDHWAGSAGVRQTGLRSLWDEAVTATRWWTSRGRPSRDRFGLITSPHREAVWLYTPGQPVPSPATTGTPA
ncbi:hypothetical protein ACIQXD_36380 [Streptomyces uncialis]|uniref:hypothetical protein n=1 Tax=Streptomyces uncialis TaxID=1048205 RepID=UPI0038083D67